MPSSTPLLAPYYLRQLFSRCFARVTHGNVQVLMSVVTLGVMTDDDISSRKMKPQRHMVQISLVMMMVASLNGHRAAHNCRE
jgi:hypothetical protein